MKQLLSPSILAGALLSFTGCVDNVHRQYSRPGYYHDGRRATTYETHRVYRDNRHPNDDVYRRHDSGRVYGGPQPHRTDVRISL